MTDKETCITVYSILDTLSASAHNHHKVWPIIIIIISTLPYQPCPLLWVNPQTEFKVVSIVSHSLLGNHHRCCIGASTTEWPLSHLHPPLLCSDSSSNVSSPSASSLPSWRPWLVVAALEPSLRMPLVVAVSSRAVPSSLLFEVDVVATRCWASIAAVVGGSAVGSNPGPAAVTDDDKAAFNRSAIFKYCRQWSIQVQMRNMERVESEKAHKVTPDAIYIAWEQFRGKCCLFFYIHNTRHERFAKFNVLWIICQRT